MTVASPGSGPHAGADARPVAVVATTVPQTLDTFFRELVRQLLRSHDVHVVAGPGTELDVLAAELGVTPHAIPMRREIAPHRDLLGLLAWWRLLRRLRPEVVITATPKASLLGMAAARVAGTPRRVYLVVGLRLEGASGLTRAVLTRAEWLTCACATRVVTNSRSLLEVMRRLLPSMHRKLSAITPGSSHGVDAVRFAPRACDPATRRALDIADDRLVIGFVGRLTRDKGVDVLLEAVRLLALQGAPVHLVVVGPQDEPDSRRYVELLAEAGLPISVVGSVRDVRPYFAAMDVHALPSLREGFPNVVLEASAMAVPTVTTDATGCVDSVRDGVTGLVVPAGDGPALADALGVLLRDASLRQTMGQAARAWVAEDFRPSEVTHTLLTLAGIREPAA